MALVAVLGSLIGSPPDGGAPAQPRGSLDKEIIRRIIRRHINDVKWCYEQELVAKPLLAGRILVKFTIGASGDVIASELQHSTMGNPRVESCTVQAVRRWQFPKPLGAGSVIVSYPFVLTPTPTPLVGGHNGAGRVEIAPISAHFFVHRSSDDKADVANGLVVVTDAGLLLVDTAWSESQVEAILSWGDNDLRRPWIGSVITHDHRDRVGGLGALFRRKIPVAALDLTVAKLAHRGVRGVTTLFAASAGTVDDARGFQAFYPGPGHAADNIVIAFPREQLVFGGCLIKAADAGDLGFTADADLGAWPAAVRRVAERYSNMRIVPGHGDTDPLRMDPYQHTLDLLRAMPARSK